MALTLLLGLATGQKVCSMRANENRSFGVIQSRSKRLERLVQKQPSTSGITAPVHKEVGEQVWATLRFLEKLTLTPGEVAAANIEPLHQAGISEQGIREAIYICFVFCTINRMADAFEFDMPSEVSYQRLGFTLYNMGMDWQYFQGNPQIHNNN